MISPDQSLALSCIHPWADIDASASQKYERFPITHFYAKTRVLPLVGLFLCVCVWLFNAFSLGSFVTVVFTAMLSLATICQHISMSSQSR